MMRRHVAYCFVVAALVLVGCGRKTVHVERHEVFPVEGSVIWKGKPLAEARIEFFPNGWKLKPFSGAPIAKTGPDGRFRVSSYNDGDGAPAGKYILTVVCQDPEAKKQKKMFSTANILPKQYADPKTSGLEVEIGEGANVIPPLDLGGESDAPSDKGPAKTK
jgi:hypothetical protein